MRICLVLFLAVFADIARADASIVIGKHAQLFLDDRIVEHAENLKRTIHQPTPDESNPVLTYEKPWEHSCVTLWGTVLYDEQDRIFKMWYQSWGVEPKPNGTTLICYATSKDGLKWERPDLGLIPYNGDTHTNIVVAPVAPWLDSPTVVKDFAEADSSKRYKMSHCESGPGIPPGIWHATSPDGVRWTRMEGPVVQAGDRNSMFYDGKRKKWVVITRMPTIADRTIGFAEGSEFGKYDPMRLIFRKDEKDPAESDLYSMPTFAYADLFIGCVEVYEHATGREITQLAWSHDGRNWTRDPERQPFMLWGEQPAWDWARRTPHNGPPIVRDDKLWIYYGGRSTLKRSPDPRRIVGAIGLSTLRIDGFCSRDAGEKEATLVTKPLRADGGEISINADVKPGGSLIVELLDAEGAPMGTSEPMTGDNVRHAVKWSTSPENAGLGTLVGQPIKLKFKLRNAGVYSFRIH